jgi:voltage-gated potassium channel
MTFREKVWDLLEARKCTDGDGQRDLDWYDKLVIVLIVANVIAIILGSDPRFSSVWLTGFQWFSVAFFAIEYALRIWSCTADDAYVRPIKDRIAYVTSPMGLIDLLAIVPFAMILFMKDPNPRVVEFLMLFRLFWLFKLARYSKTIGFIDDIIRSRRKELAVAFGFVGVLVILSASGVWFFEKAAQPDKFGTIPLAMWWSIVTLTTIGYGDVFPITVAGRVFAGATALLAIGMVALPAGILASAFAEHFTKLEVDKEMEEICPMCKRPHDQEA